MKNSEVLSHHVALGLRPFSRDSGESNAYRLKLNFSVHRRREKIEFAFTLIGKMPSDLLGLVLPDCRAPEAVRRRDDIWQSTCLEVFIGRPDHSSYIELNLCPSGDWNVYAFDSYRKGMRPVSNVEAPLVRFDREPVGDILAWQGQLRGQGILDLLAAPGLVMNATAVLEYKTGEREYWALAHPGEKPDFHLREGFCLPL